MPEGPEIRRAADKVARRLRWRLADIVKLAYPPISEFVGSSVMQALSQSHPVARPS